MTAAARMAARVVAAGFLLLFALPLAAGPAAAEPATDPGTIGSITGSTDPSTTPSTTGSTDPSTTPTTTGSTIGSTDPSTTTPTSTTPTSTPSGSPAASPETPGPRIAPAGTVTATAAVDCAAQAVVVTASNATSAAVTIGVFASGASVPLATLEVAAGATGTVRAEPGAGPFDVVVRRLDADAVLATAQGFFPCPERHDLSIQVRSGSAYSARDVCAVAFLRGPRGPLHGSLVVRDRGFVYTPEAGYTGPDRFDYECATSEGIFGTVRVTVLPGAAPSPTAPPAAAPQLPATGSSRLPVELAAGVVLVAAGALGLRLTRR